MQHPVPLHRSLPRDIAVRVPVARSVLTPGQLDVLALLSAGRAQKQIADELGISDSAVKARLAAARDALKARTTCHAVALSWRYGFLPRD